MPVSEHVLVTSFFFFFFFSLPSSIPMNYKTHSAPSRLSRQSLSLCLWPGHPSKVVPWRHSEASTEAAVRALFGKQSGKTGWILCKAIVIVEVSQRVSKLWIRPRKKSLRNNEHPSLKCHSSEECCNTDKQCRFLRVPLKKKYFSFF